MALTFLERFRTASPTPAPVVFDGLAQVRAYWEALRTDSLPARLSLDPRGLAGVLDRVFIAERIGKGLAQVRIAGSGLADFAGLDLRGLPLSCLFASESRGIFGEVLERVFATPSVAEIDLGADRGTQGTVVARILLMPLRTEGDRQQLLGAIGFNAASHSRCKFQVLARREERLVLPSAPAAAAAPTPVRRKAHLTLVHSNH
ncbi:MAG: PAS domain-containing protein [Tabrizicola sp.]|nr:PAS domain-containing protein [Tabrizicola sp.]